MRESILEVQTLKAGYVPGFPILRGINLTLKKGEVVSVIGPNGAGKSTLIKAIAGLVHIEDGEILHHSRNITGIRPDEMATFGISYIPQTDNIFRTLSIHQNLLLAAKRGDKQVVDNVEKMYSLFPALRDKQQNKAGQLSGGQRQMLAIAMALVVGPTLILMDEPTAGLSPKIAGEILVLAQDIAREGVSVLLVEQNVKAALRISDRTYILAEGQNQLDGPSQELVENQVVAEIYLGKKRFSQ